MPPEMRTHKGSKTEPPAVIEGEATRVEVFWAGTARVPEGWYRGTVDRVKSTMWKGSIEKPESQEWRHEFHVKYDDGDSKMHAPSQDEFWHLGPLMSE